MALWCRFELSKAIIAWWWYFLCRSIECTLAVILMDKRIISGFQVSVGVLGTCTLTFMGSVVTRGWFSMAPGLCRAMLLGKWPLALEKHWLLLSEMLCCRAKQTSVAEEVACGVRPGEVKTHFVLEAKHCIWNFRAFYWTGALPIGATILCFEHHSWKCWNLVFESSH